MTKFGGKQPNLGSNSHIFSYTYIESVKIVVVLNVSLCEDDIGHKTRRQVGEAHDDKECE